MCTFVWEDVTCTCRMPRSCLVLFNFPSFQLSHCHRKNSFAAPAVMLQSRMMYSFMRVESPVETLVGKVVLNCVFSLLLSGFIEI